MTWAIAPLAPGEAETLCALARAVWRHHYPPIIGAAQTEYMLAQRYDPARIRDELANGTVWWDTVRERDVLLAFAASFAVPEDRAMQIDKLYVHPERQRAGLGGALIEHVRQRAEQLGLEKLVLAVNKGNASAITAYHKHGFRIARPSVTDIGGGFVMDDYLMEKLL